MIRKILFQRSFLILLFISSSFLYAQTNSSISTKPLNESSFATFSIFSSLDPFNPRYRVGYIQNLSPKWKLGVDLGYGSRKLSWSSSLFTTTYLTSFGGAVEEDYRLWEIRPELYYIIDPSHKYLQYISTEVFYIHQTDAYQHDHVDKNDMGYFNFDKADFKRQKIGSHIKYGIFINPGEKLGLNVYTGIGFRFRNNTFSDIINLVPYDDPREVAVDYNEVEGLFFGFNFSFGFRLYYRFER